MKHPVAKDTKAGDKRKQSVSEKNSDAIKIKKARHDGSDGDDSEGTNPSSDSECSNETPPDDPECPAGLMWLCDGTVVQLLEDPAKWKDEDTKEAVVWWCHEVENARKAIEKENADMVERKEKDKLEEEKAEDSDESDFYDDPDEDERMELQRTCISENVRVGGIDFKQSALKDPRSKLFLDNLRKVKAKCKYPRVTAMIDEPTGANTPCLKVIVGELDFDARIASELHETAVRWLTGIRGWEEGSSMKDEMSEFMETLADELLRI